MAEKIPCPEGSLATTPVCWEEGERVCFAGEANTFLQPISIALYQPTAACNLAPQIRKAAFPILPVPPAGEVWQLCVFWSWRQQHCAADECVAKSHGFGREVLWCGSGHGDGGHSTAAQAHGLTHICSDPAALPVLQESGKGRGWSGSVLSILFATPSTAVAVTRYPPFFQLSSVALSSASTVKGPNSSQVSTQRLNWRDTWDGFSPLHSVLIILLQKPDAVPKAQAGKSSWSPAGLGASFQRARGSFIH